MYDIKQFKPALYLVLILGLSGFAMAANAPELWLFAMLALGLNAWLVHSGRFSPMPRWLVNLVTLVALGYIILRVNSGPGTPLMAVAQFLVLLQLVKLYEHRANRDYAQLLILSLLLMVAAAINATSLAFGVVLLVYLVISLYCCLIFHLKVEADRARAALAIPEDKISPLTIRQDQRFLPRSMRRLTGFVLVNGLTVAILVFIFFPRGTGSGMLGQFQLRVGTALTGLGGKVGFDDEINNVLQNPEVVAHVTVWRNDRLIEHQPIMLRGYTLDTYGAEVSRSVSKPEWTRSWQPSDEAFLSEKQPVRGTLRPAGDIWRQRVVLRPTGLRYLFAMQGLIFQQTDRGIDPVVRPERAMNLRCGLQDDALMTSEALNVQFEYEVWSTNTPRAIGPFDALMRQTLPMPGTSDPKVLEQIREFTLRPEITDGLAAKRPRLYPIHELNEPIASKIESYLRGNYSYTLDLTDSTEQFRNTDPVVAFLTKVRKGYCMHFASAMALMCQSLGIPARVVVGFKCDDYNSIGRYYIVRQSHAHMWVEVLTQRGWVAFDPTSGRTADTNRAGGFFQGFKHFFDYLEYKWAENVITYDRTNQQGVMRSADTALTNAVVRVDGFVHDLFSFHRGSESAVTFWRAFFDILATIIGLMVAAIFAAIAWYLIQQYRLRRRAARIGFDTLPVNEQIRLAKQLAFYDQLARVLERHQIVRPPHLTPLEFAHSLVYLPGAAYDAIRRLTGILYRVRFGNAKLNAARQHRLETVVSNVASAIEHFRAPG